jgi:branched-chain amino acid transport system ATP-binding protein
VSSADVIVRISGISKHFGGLAALQDVSIAVGRGSITSVIGPNGAGKTTLINVLSGFLQPDSGSIALNGTAVTGRKPHAITRLGMARTFQTAQVFGQMSVLENVMVGCHARTRTGLAGAALRLPGVRSEERAIRAKAHGLLAMVGLADQAAIQAASIPIGSQRLLEIARALASQPAVLLLDEPAAGLNTQETRRLGELLLAIRQQGITIMLVEHDMELVMDISDEIAVLHFGRSIARGTPAQIQANPDVIAVYLGEE